MDRVGGDGKAGAGGPETDGGTVDVAEEGSGRVGVLVAPGAGAGGAGPGLGMAWHGWGWGGCLTSASGAGAGAGASAGGCDSTPYRRWSCRGGGGAGAAAHRRLSSPVSSIKE